MSEIESDDDQSSDKTGVKQRCFNIPKGPRTFILRAIAAWKTDDWIVAEVKERFGLEVAHATVRMNYRYGPVYRVRIAEYRREYEARAEEHPLYSKHYMLDLLHDLAQEARQNKDYRAADALIKQARELTGMKTVEALEINHNINGRVSFENRLATIQEAMDATPALPGDTDGDVIDVQTVARTPQDD
jgi:hypothetical protein